MNTFKLRLNKHTQQKDIQNILPVETKITEQDKKIIQQPNIETLAKEPELKVGNVSNRKRPPKPAEKKKTSVIRVYCTEREKKLFQEFCSAENISESSYLEKFIKKANRAFKNNRLD